MPRKKDPRKVGTEPRGRTFLYKRATFGKEPETRTLESMLDEAWRVTGEEAKDRRQVTHEDSGASIVTHYRTKRFGISFYEIIVFTPGMKAMAAAMDFSAPSLEIANVAVKDDEGNELQLIEYIAYLAVCDNDVVLVPSAELRAPVIESHANWLLREAAGTLEEEQEVRLSNRIPPTKEKAIKRSRKVSFSTPVEFTAQKEAGTGRTSIRPTGTVWQGVKQILSDFGESMVDVASDLEREGLTESTPVEVDISLRWHRPPKRQTNELLDRVATGLRHLDTEADYSIEAGSTKLTKSEIILRRTRQVHCRGERPVRDLLWEAIKNWYEELQESGEIA